MSLGDGTVGNTSLAPSLVSVGPETTEDRSWLEGTLVELGSFFHEDVGLHTDRAVWSLLQLACVSLVRTVSAIRAARSEVTMLSHRSLPSCTVLLWAWRSSSNPVVSAKPRCVSRLVLFQQVLFFQLLLISLTTTRMRYATTTPKSWQLTGVSCCFSEDVLSAPHIRHAVSTEGQPLYNSTYSWRCNVGAHVAAQAIDVVLFKSLSDQSRQSSPFTYHLPKALESGGRSMSAELIFKLLSFFQDEQFTPHIA